MILGYWLRWLGETSGEWEKVRCRGDIDWLKRDEFSLKRALEVNFVDIGQGDGCHSGHPPDPLSYVFRDRTFFGLPRGRSVDSSSSLPAVRLTQASFPNGWPRLIARRSASSSGSV